MQPSLLAAPSNIQGNLDVIKMASDLNCHRFDSNCHWSNADEDELDWNVLLSTPEVEPLVSALETTNIPDALAATLLAVNRNPWDSGQLVSDLLPCIVRPLQLTATVWRSSNELIQQQPNLKICSRNAYADQLHANCILFPVQNGIPVTVNIPEPHDPTTPAQIIILGDNFIGKHSGAIFIQDITVNGDLVPDCSLATPFTIKHFPKIQRQQSRPLIPLHSFEDSPTNNHIKVPSSLADSLILQCIKLSCNPAVENCGWKNSLTNGWLASTGFANYSNPLTGITVPPVGTEAFLVASFGRNLKNSIRQIISPLISISTSTQLVYFCFYEYFALDRARFTMCTDQFGRECFYSKFDIPKNGHLQESRRWNFQCTELPFGIFKIYVTAENHGPNHGDIGFVPLRLSRDLGGNDPIC